MPARPIRIIYPTSKFKKSFRKLFSEIQKLAIKGEQFFRKNTFDPKLKTHKLKGKLKKFWSYSVNYEYRIVFEFLKKDVVLYHDIGTHEIYR